MIEKLHFKVDPSILTIIRQAYWYEGREKWAYDCLSCIPELSLGLANKLLMGDAHFITEDGGKTLSVVEEDEKQFKKEIASHLKWKEKEKKRKELEMKRLKKEAEIDEFGILKKRRNKIVEDIIYPIDRFGNEEVRAKYSNNYLANQFMMSAMSKTDKKERKQMMQIAMQYKNKVYEFDFKGKHYTFLNNARNQGECPHCGKHSADNIWRKTDKAFLGKCVLNKDMLAYCFECPECFGHFYYHQIKEYDTK